jgi:acetolactate synthase small subunit
MSQALQEYRRRIAQRGIKRVEVSAQASDADLIRRMAKVLDKDDEAAERLRAALQRLVPRTSVKFEDWLTQPEDDGR